MCLANEIGINRQNIPRQLDTQVVSAGVLPASVHSNLSIEFYTTDMQCVTQMQLETMDGLFTNTGSHRQRWNTALIFVL